MKRFFQCFMGHRRSEDKEEEERVNVTREFGTTILHYACANNIENIIGYILDERINVNTIDNFGFTPLHLACDVGAINIVRMLLEAGADTNILTSKGETALYIACDRGNIEIARMLLQYGADASIKTEQEDTSLNLACKHRNIELVRLLLDNKAVREGDTRVDATPLRYACESGDLDMVELLLERISRLSTDRALHWACESKNYYLVEALIDRGANVNAVDAFGQTPLHIACSRRMHSIIKLLVKRKADVNKADMFGNTPLKAIVRAFREVSLIQLLDMVETIRLLIDNFADLSVLSKKKDDRLVSMLLEDPNARICARVALHIRDVDCLRKSLSAYYNKYKPEYNNPLRRDLGNLRSIKDNLDELEEMIYFVKRLKTSQEYLYLKKKLEKMLISPDTCTDDVRCIKDLFCEVNKFWKDVHHLRNTKVIESVVLPVKKVRESIIKK